MLQLEPEDEELLALFDDEYARTIIVETYQEPCSANRLSEICDADPSTVYRRIDRLRDLEILEAKQRIDPDGHHYKVYEAQLEHVGIDVTNRDLKIDTEYVEEEAADTFTRLYEEFSG